MKKLIQPHLAPQASLLILGGACMVITALTTAVLSTTLKPIFDDIFIGHRRELLQMVAVGVLVVFVLKGLSEYGAALCAEIAGQNMIISLQKKLFSHLVFLDLAFFRARHEGHVTSLLLHDVRTLKASVLQTLNGFLKEGVTVMALLFVIFRENAKLASIALGGFPLILFLLVSCGRNIRKISWDLSLETASLHTFFQQIFQNITLVKASHTEVQEMESLEMRLEKMSQHVVKTGRIRALIHPIMEILGGLAIVMVLVQASLQVIKGRQTTGSFLTFITALLFIYRPMKNIIHLNTQLQEGLAAAERIQSVLETEETIEKQARLPLMIVSHSSQIFRGDIRFEHVTFGYDTHSSVLQDVSCSFEGGKRLALVGPSGSGKTTLFHLLLRFYRPQQGKILWGGIDIATMNLLELRKHIAFVSQDIVLFDESVANNIRYGMNATEEEVRQAAHLAFADEFIETLPQQYEARIGANGVKLSGGQRQRLALARAFLRNAPLLLLDEATSSLDAVSEGKIRQATERLSQERTVLIIAHRFSTIEKADKIFVMSKGGILEQGTHEQLIEQQGLYERMALFGTSVA
jgi:subfamily B ATP-binding cassette protein MsbA